MKGIRIALLAFVAGFFVQSTFAQDTVNVQTLTFNDITKRSGTWNFPTEGKTWEKVLMHYTLKCDPQTTRDRFDCGEWDYLSYTIVTDSTGRLDSTRKEHPNYILGRTSPDSVLMTLNKSLYKQYYNLYFKVVDSTIMVDSAVVGNANTTYSLDDMANGRVQFVYTASELQASGLQAGEITSLAFNSVNGFMFSDMTIRMGHSTGVAPTDFQNENMVEVHKAGKFQPWPAHVHFDFHQPFNWDGTSDVILEFAATNGAGGLGGTIGAEQTTLPSQVIASDSGHYIKLDNNGFFDLSDADQVMSTLDSQITISFWAYGDDRLPVNTSALEAKDKNGNRVLNIHLPWGNSSVYWDAGNDGGSYDRINKAAGDDEIKGGWNHWAFVKNANTGSMKIYLNSTLWHSGTGSTRTMKGIRTLIFGSGNRNNQYRGSLDQLRVWNTELTQKEISDWMKKELTNTHSSFSDLLFEFDFEPTQFVSGRPYEFRSTQDASIVGRVLGTHKLMPHFGTSYNLAGNVGNVRPVVHFYKAQENWHLDSVERTVELPVGVQCVELFDNATDPLQLTGYDGGYAAGWIFDLGSDGSKVDSTWVPSTTAGYLTYNPYYDVFEVINHVEIGRFITPYGIGLDLGPDGFRWVYDVTDYVDLLQGDVTLSAGNQQELIDLRFEFIQGTPPREVKNVQYLSNRESRQYKSIADDTYFKNDTLDLLPESETFKLITRITGHGHNGESGGGKIHCCEWADKEHYLFINGKQEFAWDIWQDDKCALNPVSDQGGNWAPPRAGWCPSAPVDDYIFELTDLITEDQVAIDYDIEDVPSNNVGQGNGNYVVSMHLVEYGAITHELDAAIKDIISPNNWEFYSRINPTCTTPKIVLQNKGTEPLVGALLKYGVVGGNPIQFYWEGNLGFMEEEVIDLPFAIWDYVSPDEVNKFYAEVALANGKTDDYAQNNKVTVDYNSPELLPSNLEVMFRNNDIEDADLTITNDRGDVVYSKIGAPARELTRDQVNFDAGCYKLEVVTENGFGLTYPLIPQVGTGFLRLRQTDGVKNVAFNLDFGKKLTYHFTIGYGLNTEEELESTQMWEVYPNPSSGIFTISADGNELGMYTVTDMSGRVISEGQTDRGIAELDLSAEMSGVYILKIVQGNKIQTEKLIKQ